MEDILQNVGVILTGVLVLAFNWLRQKLEERQSKDLRKSRSIDLKLAGELAELRVLFEADKVLMFQFHNGGKYFNGLSIKKLSLTNFQVRNGVEAPRLADYQNIPTSFMPHFLHEVTIGKIYLTKVSEVKDSYLAQLLISGGIEQIMAIEVESTEKDTIAVIVLCWITESIIQESDETLLEYAKKIGADLSFK